MAGRHSELSSKSPPALNEVTTTHPPPGRRKVRERGFRRRLAVPRLDKDLAFSVRLPFLHSSSSCCTAILHHLCHQPLQSITTVTHLIKDQRVTLASPAELSVPGAHPSPRQRQRRPLRLTLPPPSECREHSKISSSTMTRRRPARCAWRSSTSRIKGSGLALADTRYVTGCPRKWVRETCPTHLRSRYASSATTMSRLT